MRRRCLHRCRRGCFHLPRIPEAKVVKNTGRANVPWLAETDSDKRSVEFSALWERLTPVQRRYIVLHERAHLKTGHRHNERFFKELMSLVDEAHVPWKVAFELESWNCHKSH